MSSSLKNSPVFIVAPVRSGSTLLHLVLDAHPDISNPGECDFMFDMVNDIGVQPDMQEYLTWLSINRIFLAKNLQVDEKYSYPALMNSFFAQLLGSKNILTMNVHRNFQRIPSVFPNALYIHLLRDPRDVARSCIGMGWAGHVYYGVDIWIEAEQSWDRLRSVLSNDQYLEINYEDLIKKTVETLTKICEFLGVKYSEKMMDYTHTSTYSAPDPSLIAQWERKSREREIQLIEGKVAPLLVERGYQLSNNKPITPGFIENIGLALLNKVYKIGYRIRAYGILLYLEELFAKKVRLQSWRRNCQHRMNMIDTERLK